MSVLGPFPAYLSDRFPPSRPINPADPNTYQPFAADLLERHTKHARRHKLGLWNCPRCDPGSAAWFKAARAMGQCASKNGGDAVTQGPIKDYDYIDASVSVPMQIYIVF